MSEKKQTCEIKDIPAYTTDLSAAVALAERVLGIVRMKWVFQDTLDAWQPKDGVPAFVVQFVTAILTAKAKPNQ